MEVDLRFYSIGVRTGAEADGPVYRSSAEQFIARRADGSPTILAGYPWFTDWGRDTMISLPGLLIAPGRLDEARAVLRGFLAHLHQGLIPNRFSDAGGTPEYNSADATLWMFQAVRAWFDAGGDRAFLRDVFYPAAEIHRMAPARHTSRHRWRSGRSFITSGRSKYAAHLDGRTGGKRRGNAAQRKTRGD